VDDHQWYAHVAHVRHLRRARCLGRTAQQAVVGRPVQLGAVYVQASLPCGSSVAHGKAQICRGCGV
jgi:hypothetical protein